MLLICSAIIAVTSINLQSSSVRCTCSARCGYNNIGLQHSFPEKIHFSLIFAFSFYTELL